MVTYIYTIQCLCGKIAIQNIKRMKLQWTSLCFEGHGATFKVDCKSCFCYAGETICFPPQCPSLDTSAEPRRAFTGLCVCVCFYSLSALHSTSYYYFCLSFSISGLPCGCPDRFVPVCASNGRTYPSACMARCMGFQDNQFVFGSCRTTGPCSPNPCQRNQRWAQDCPRAVISQSVITLDIIWKQIQWIGWVILV